MCPLHQTVCTPSSKTAKSGSSALHFDLDPGFFLQAALQSAYLSLLRKGWARMLLISDSLPTILCILYQAYMLLCTHSIHSTASLNPLMNSTWILWRGLCKHTAGILVSAWPLCGVDVPVMSSRCQCFNTGDLSVTLILALFEMAS